LKKKVGDPPPMGLCVLIPVALSHSKARVIALFAIRIAVSFRFLAEGEQRPALDALETELVIYFAHCTHSFRGIYRTAAGPTPDIIAGDLQLFSSHPPPR